LDGEGRADAEDSVLDLVGEATRAGPALLGAVEGVEDAAEADGETTEPCLAPVVFRTIAPLSKDFWFFFGWFFAGADVAVDLTGGGLEVEGNGAEVADCWAAFWATALQGCEVG
jgi:hypothetical protein